MMPAASEPGERTALLSEVRRLAADLLGEEVASAGARSQLYAAMREAYEAGISPTLIADAAGLTRQRLYQIMQEERKKGAPE